MAEFTRSDTEVRALMDRFIAASRNAEETHDWAPLADFYAEDAVYRYSLGAAGARVAEGREEIRRLVMQRDMQGFEGWHFPYDWVATDGDKVITKWWNEAPAQHEDGTPYRVVGNSSLRLNQDLEIVEMHDNFDLAALLAMVQDLNRRGLTKIHIPEAEEAQDL